MFFFLALIIFFLHKNLKPKNLKQQPSNTPKPAISIIDQPILLTQKLSKISNKLPYLKLIPLRLPHKKAIGKVKKSIKSQSTHYPKSKISNYQPYTMFKLTNAYRSSAGSSRKLDIDLFIPIWQNRYNIIFSDLRVNSFLRKNNGYNLGLGYRHLSGDKCKLYGIYAYFDQGITGYDNKFSQLTLGVEHWLHNWFLGGNFYRTIGEKSKFTNANKNYREKSLYGVDALIGHSFNDSLTSYIGGYYYFDYNSSRDIRGEKLLLSYDWRTSNGKRVVEIFDQVGIEASATHDNHRGNTFSLALNFRISWTTNTQPAADGMIRRMTDPIRRNNEIITITSAVLADSTSTTTKSTKTTKPTTPRSEQEKTPNLNSESKQNSATPKLKFEPKQRPVAPKLKFEPKTYYLRRHKVDINDIDSNKYNYDIPYPFGYDYERHNETEYCLTIVQEAVEKIQKRKERDLRLNRQEIRHDDLLDILKEMDERDTKRHYKGYKLEPHSNYVNDIRATNINMAKIDKYRRPPGEISTEDFLEAQRDMREYKELLEKRQRFKTNQLIYEDYIELIKNAGKSEARLKQENAFKHNQMTADDELDYCLMTRRESEEEKIAVIRSKLNEEDLPIDEMMRYYSILLYENDETRTIKELEQYYSEINKPVAESRLEKIQNWLSSTWDNLFD